jgi:hypothetical protein
MISSFRNSLALFAGCLIATLAFHVGAADKQNWLARATRQTNDMTFLEQVPLIAVAKRRSQLRLD